MNKKLLLFILPIFLFMGLFAFNFFKTEEIELNSFNYKNSPDEPLGSLLYDLTFENAVNKFSANVIVGHVNESSYYSDRKSMYSIQVIEDLVGNTESVTINILTNKNILETGEEYILFLNSIDSPVYSEKFYVLLSEFVLKIDNNNQLLRLEDSVNMQYIPPFVDESKNNLTFAKSYINKIKHENIYLKNPKKVVVDEANSLNDLINISDHILEITVVSAENANETLLAVKYNVNEIYKGGNLTNINYLIMPTGIEEGKKYLIFLSNREESVTLATRKGSIIEEGTDNYENAIRLLER